MNVLIGTMPGRIERVKRLSKYETVSAVQGEHLDLELLQLLTPGSEKPPGDD